MQRNLTQYSIDATNPNAIGDPYAAANISGANTLNPPIDPNAQTAGAIPPEQLNASNGNKVGEKVLNPTTGTILDNSIKV